MDGTAVDPTPATEVPVDVGEVVPAAPPAPTEPARPTLRAVESPTPATSFREALSQARTKAVPSEPPRKRSRAEEARAARAARKAAEPATIAPTPTPAPRKEAAEVKADRWARERVRIGTERQGWTTLLQSTLTPTLMMGASLFGGMDLSAYGMQVPVLQPDGSGGTWRGAADAGVSVLLGQTLATLAPGGDQLEHPLAVPILAFCTVSMQFMQIIFLRRVMGKSEAEVQEITRKAVADSEKLEREALEALAKQGQT